MPRPTIIYLGRYFVQVSRSAPGDIFAYFFKSAVLALLKQTKTGSVTEGPKIRNKSQILSHLKSRFKMSFPTG
jgi:hypothetical protein